MALGKLEILGVFNNSQWRRAFGEATTDIKGAKNAWQEMGKTVKGIESEIGGAIKENSRQIDTNTKKIENLRRQQNSPLKTKPWEWYDKEATSIEKATSSLKRQNAELERTLRIEKSSAFRDTVGGGLKSVGAAGLRIIGTGLAVGGAAAGAALTKGFFDNMSLDRQMTTVYNALETNDSNVKGRVKNQILDTAKKTGVDSNEIADMQGFLYSSGFAPDKKKQGTLEYMKQIDEVGVMAERIATSARASGASSTDMMKALVYSAGAYGGSEQLKDPKKLEEMLDAFAFAQKQGIGSMGDYAQEFQKFLPSGKDAGWGMKESMALFAETTKHYNTSQAGNVMVNFAKLFEQANAVQQYAAGKGKVGKDGLSAIDKVYGASSEEKNILKGLSKGGLSKMFYDEKGGSRGMMSTMKLMNESYSKLTSESAKGMFMQMISKNNSIAAKELRMLFGQQGTYIDENGIEQKIKGINMVDELISDANNIEGMNAGNIENLKSSSSNKWDTMIQTWKTGMMKIVGENEGGIAKLITAFTNLGNALPELDKKLGSFINGLGDWFTGGHYTGIDKINSDAKGIIDNSLTGKSTDSEVLLKNANTRAAEQFSKMVIYGENGANSTFGFTPTKGATRFQKGYDVSFQGLMSDIVTGLDGKVLPGYIKPDGKTFDMEKVLPIMRGMLANRLGTAASAGADNSVIMSLESNIKTVDSVLQEFKTARELEAANAKTRDENSNKNATDTKIVLNEQLETLKKIASNTGTAQTGEGPTISNKLNTGAGGSIQSSVIGGFYNP